MTGSTALSGRRPRARKGVEEQAADGGRWRLRVRGGTGVGEVEARERDLWRLLDGEKTVEELVLACMAWPNPAGPEWVAQTLARLARAGLLEGDWETPRAGAHLVARLGGPVAISDGSRRILAGAGGFTLGLLGCASVLLIAMAIGLRGISLMPLGSGPWGLLLAAYAILLAGQAARLLGGLAAAGAIQTVGVTRRYGIPVLGHVPAAEGAEPRRTVPLWGLGAELAFAGAMAFGALATGRTGFDQALAVAIVLLVLEIGPVFPGDGLALLIHWAGDRHVRERALAFLNKRFFVRMAAGDTLLPEEGRLLGVGLWLMGWSLGALRFGTILFRESAAGFSAVLAPDVPGVTRLLALAMLAGLLFGLGRALLQILLTPIRWAANSGFRGDRYARLMVPAGGLAAAGILVAPAAVVALLYFVLAGVVLLMLFRQARNIPGSRFEVGYYALLAGLGLHVLTEGPRVLESIGALRWEVLPAGALAWGVAFTPVCFGAFGLSALLEAARIRFRPLDWMLAGAMWGVVAGAGLFPLERPDLLALAAYALVPAGTAILLLQRRDTPMRYFWRPFCLGAIFLGVSCWLPARPGEPLPAPPVAFTIALVWILAALSASNAMFLVPMPSRRRPDGHRAGATPVEALWDGGGHVLVSLLDVTRFFLGNERAEHAAASFNAAMSKGPGFRMRVEEGALRIDGLELPEAGVLGPALRRGLAVLEREAIGSAGRRFLERALAVATEGLYWLEWEAVQTHMLTAGRPSTGAELIEEVSRVALFRSLNAAQLDELVRVLRRERFGAGEFVARQGEPGDRFYVVSRGELDVVQEDVLGFSRHLATLQAGDCFGEVALLGKGVRSASVVARGRVELISLGKEDFERFLPGKEGVTALIRYGGFLRRMPIFSSLPSAVLSRLAAALEPRDYAGGTTVLERGQRSEKLLLVKDGRLETGGGPIGPGDAFGQECLTGQTTVPSEVLAGTPSTVLWLSREEVIRTLASWLAGVRDLDELAERGSAAGWDNAIASEEPARRLG